MASLNTGNNLLYLLLALLLALLVMQNVLAEWHFRGLSVGRRLPSEAFAGEGVKGELWVMNNRRALASFSLVLEEEQNASAVAAVSWVGPGQQVHVPATYTFAARGTRGLGRILSLPVFRLVCSRAGGPDACRPKCWCIGIGEGPLLSVAQGEESADPRRKVGTRIFWACEATHQGFAEACPLAEQCKRAWWSWSGPRLARRLFLCMWGRWGS